MNDIKVIENLWTLWARENGTRWRGLAYGKQGAMDSLRDHHVQVNPKLETLVLPPGESPDARYAVEPE